MTQLEKFIGNTLLRIFPLTFFGFQPVAISGYKEYDRLGNYLGGSKPYLLNKEEKLIYLSRTGIYLIGAIFQEKSDLSESAKSPASDID